MPKQSGLGRGLGSLIPKKVDSKKLADTDEKKPESVFFVETEKIKVNPRQPRRVFAEKDMDNLKESVRLHGIIQPLVVTEADDGYELIAGERRLRAARDLDLEKVPAVIRTANEQEKLEIALIENVQRSDLNPVEEAMAYKALLEEFNLTQDEVAGRVGKSRPVVANTIRLLELPEEILNALRAEKISRSHARTLLAESDPEKREKLFRQILSGGVTVRQTEARVNGKKRSRAPKIQDPNVKAHEDKLREILGTKVAIQEKNGQGKIVIDFYSREELRDLLDRLTD